jgi:hypothetical protein
MASTLSYWSSVVSSTEVRVSMPALFTIMSNRPNPIAELIECDHPAGHDGSQPRELFGAALYRLRREDFIVFNARGATIGLIIG